MTTGSKNIRMRRLAACLFFSTAMSSVGTSTPAFAQSSNDQYWNAFTYSNYRYCDALLISRYWNQSVGQAKVAIGMKIATGYGHRIPILLQNARNAGNYCNFGDTGFSYSDAQAIANHWRMSNVAEVKSKMADMVTHGHIAQLNQILRRH